MSSPASTGPASRSDVAVVGGGPTGLAAALAFARRGRSTVLVLRAGPATADLRTAALFPVSVQMLENMGVWGACRGDAAPLRAIRILDDTRWLLQAPETLFEAAEIGEPALAWNVTNAALIEALAAASADSPSLRVFRSEATPGYTQNRDGVTLALSGGQQIQARLVVAADGRTSPLREFAGIATRRRALDQTAVVTTFSHSRPHRDTSTEIHRDAGPLTTVPMPGNRSSLVWVERPREAGRLMALSDADFLAALQHRLMGLLGQLSALTPRMTYPLQWLGVEAFARDRVALVGEAAHVLPPIGAQGLNLGLRDIADLVESAATAIDPGAADVLEAYDRARRVHTMSRAFTVDMLNRSLEAGTLPLQLARGFGLFAMRALPLLKRTIMQHASGGLMAPPSLMRAPEVLPPLPNRQSAG